jgi:alginate O-acetyltransferase complex protein AlgI
MNAPSAAVEHLGWVRILFEDYAVLPYFVFLFATIFGIEWLRRANLTQEARQKILIAASLCLIAYLDWHSALLMCVLSGAVYHFSQNRFDFTKHLPLVTAASLLALIATKAVFTNWSPKPIVVLGLSYYVLRLISVVIEIGRKNPDYADIKPLPFFTYVFFIPIFFAGPVQKFADFRRVDADEKDVPWLYTRLALLVLLKMAVIDFLLLQAVIIPVRTDLVPAVLNWPAWARYGLFLGHGFVSIVYHYFDFVIYTELAKTVGRLLGYHVIDNFNYPLLVTNIAEFWRRWHMSMSNFARDYVFMPVMIRSRRIWLGSCATMLTIGMWHAANLNWLIWSLAHGGALVFYDNLRRTSFYKACISGTKSAKALAIAGRVATLSFIGAVNNLVAFPQNYGLAWKFTRQALFGIP